MSSALPSRLERGSPHPLGATWDGLGTNFAVFSAHAERIELCLLTQADAAKSPVCRFRNVPMKSGTVICRMRAMG